MTEILQEAVHISRHNYGNFANFVFQHYLRGCHYQTSKDHAPARQRSLVEMIMKQCLHLLLEIQICLLCAIDKSSLIVRTKADIQLIPDSEKLRTFESISTHCAVHYYCSSYAFSTSRRCALVPLRIQNHLLVIDIMPGLERSTRRWGIEKLRLHCRVIQQPDHANMMTRAQLRARLNRYYDQDISTRN